MSEHDWGGYFIAALIGASLGWCVCALWTARWLDAMRRQQRQQMQEMLNRMPNTDNPYRKGDLPEPPDRA